MREKRLRPLAVLMLALALWLPLQSAVAAAANLCRHGHTQAVQMVAVDDAEMPADCPMHHSQDSSSTAQGHHHDSDCDQCDYCHLAGLGVLAAFEQNLAVVPAAEVFATLATVWPASITVEPPRRPPRDID